MRNAVTEIPKSEIRIPHSELQLCVLASGSKGNAIFVSDGTTSVLIDAGLSGREIERRLALRGIKAQSLDGIMVSHEHFDHIQGVGVLARRYKLPVYISRPTMQAASARLKTMPASVCFECGAGFQLNTLRIHPFSVSHDVCDPAGFTISNNGSKIGIATDLGIATSLVKEHLKGCAILVLEANYDPAMLMQGPYPWPLKQRVNSRVGHLSNEASRDLLGEVRDDRLEHVILAHLSEANNTPEKALDVVSRATAGTKIKLSVASQDECGALIHHCQYNPQL
ncbi:MBL fold metallo-hydrolase [Desulfococcaceae bacterium HSG7]|nr:MBL fold metallo-hydrolase [Desulfococcaceae bacterium HSG7]